MTEAERNSLRVIADVDAGLAVRLDAAEKLRKSDSAEVVSSLQSFLERQRAEPDVFADTDPLFQERVLDIAVVGVLHSLGDDTQWPALLQAIRKAGAGWGQPVEEPKIGAVVIRDIGSKALLKEVFELCRAPEVPYIRNAVRTLVLVSLREPATHQSLEGLDAFDRTLKVAPLELSDYMKDIVKKSGGAVELSPGVERQIRENDYPVADGDPEELELIDILRREIYLFGFAYYVEASKAVICTFPEAGERWLSWWEEHGKATKYNPEDRRFLTREGESRQ